MPQNNLTNSESTREIQFGGQDTPENMWALAFSINRGAGSALNQASIPLSSGETVKVYQLRQLVAKSNRKFYFSIKSTI